MQIFLNGRILSEEQATLSVSDHGFLYGVGVFETFRTFHGKASLVDKHLERLKSGCARMRIHLPDTSLATIERLEDKVTELLLVNGLPDAIFRYTVSAGPAPPGLPRGEYKTPTELLVPRRIPETPARSISLHVLTTRRNSSEFDPRPKSLNYLNSHAGHIELLDRNVAAFDEGIMLCSAGRLSEGVTSNIFLIRDRRALTPRTNACVLPGITRQFLLTFSRSHLGFPVDEEDLALNDLENADAIFITNSVRGLVPVSGLYGADRKCLWEKNSADNPIFLELVRMYEGEVSKR